MTSPTYNKDITRDYAMGIMLNFTKNEYKNDYTLMKIEKELDALYNKVHNSELYSFFFSCQAHADKIMFNTNYDFSELNIKNNDENNNFYRTMKNLILEIKEQKIDDFEKYIESKLGFIFDFLSIFIFNFFLTYNKRISKHHENSYLRWDSFDNVKYSQHKELNISNILKKIYKVKKIVLKNTLEEETIQIQDTENIRKKYYELGEEDTLHFVYDNKEIILYKVKGKIHYLIFVQKEMHHDLLPYIFNTKNYALLSSIIHFIDYRVLSEIRSEHRDKINNFIQHSNMCNNILLKNKISKDVITHILNRLANPLWEEINDVNIYIGTSILKRVNKELDLFLFNIQSKTIRDVQVIMKSFLDSTDEIDDTLKDEKYIKMKRKIKVEIIKNMYKVFLTELGDTFLKKYTNHFEASKRKAEEFKSQSEDQELHYLIDKFQEKYV